MCQQPSKEWFFLPLFLLVLHVRPRVEQGRELFCAWDHEDVKDQTCRQIAQCNLSAVLELEDVPLRPS